MTVVVLYNKHHAQGCEGDLAVEYHLMITGHRLKSTDQIIKRFLIILITLECIFGKTNTSQTRNLNKLRKYGYSPTNYPTYSM